MLNITSDMAKAQGLDKNRLYAAQVVDNNDPTGRCRVRARVAVIMDGWPDAHLPWAIPLFDSQDGAGPGSGTQYVPKVGTKVTLQFQDGKETLPVWSGYCVDTTTVLQEMAHNYPNRKVARLQNKALVVIDTVSNEVFLRNPGSTRIYIEGDCQLTVQGDMVEHIAGNRSSFVDGDSIEVVKGNRSVFVGGADVQAVVGDITSSTGANRSTSTGGTNAEAIGGSSSFSVGGSDSYQVAGDHARNASMINDNSGGPSPSAPTAPPAAPAAPDLSSWTGIDGGAPGAFLKGFSPDATPLDVASSIGEDMEGPLSPEAKAAFAKAGIKLNAAGDGVEGAPAAKPSATDDKNPPPATALPESCASFASKTEFSPTMQLSANFTLGDLTTKALLERSPAKAQAGLTLAQVVCNLKGLAENMLDPITKKFGRPNINCGFRPSNASYGSPTGWHLKGCAADLQWGGISDAEYYERAVWVKDNLPFCEVILEYGGNRPWLHVAFSASSLSTSNFKTRVGVPSKYAKGILKLTNRPGVGGV